jgi:hypothetical protein
MRDDTRRWSSLSLGVALLVACAQPAMAQVQPTDAVGPGWWVVPTVRTAVVHEDNTLLGIDAAEASLTRVSPSMELRYQAPLRTFQAGYSVDGERYWGRLRILDNYFARQTGAMALDSRLTARSSLSVRARYLTTLRPEDALDETGLVQERRRTRAFSGETAFDRQLTPRLRARATYTVGDDDFGPPTDRRPSARSTFHALGAGVAYSLTPRTTFGMDYTGRLVYGKDLRPETIINARFGASALTARFTHAFTPTVSATIAAGPRLSQTLPKILPGVGSAPLRLLAAPEVLASLNYRRGDARVSGSYSRSQFMGYGAAGFIDTEALEGRMAVRVAQRVVLSSRSAAYRNRLLELRAKAYRVEAGAQVHAWGWLSVEAGYTYRSQNRSLTLGDTVGGSLRPRTRHSVAVGLVVQRSVRLD